MLMLGSPELRPESIEARPGSTKAKHKTSMLGPRPKFRKAELRNPMLELKSPTLKH